MAIGTGTEVGYSNLALTASPKALGGDERFGLPSTGELGVSIVSVKSERIRDSS